MKRILLLVLTLVMVMSLLAACNGKEEGVPVDPVDDGSTQITEQGTTESETENQNETEEIVEDQNNTIDFDDLLAAAEDTQ